MEEAAEDIHVEATEEDTAVVDMGVVMVAVVTEAVVVTAAAEAPTPSLWTEETMAPGTSRAA